MKYSSTLPADPRYHNTDFPRWRQYVPGELRPRGRHAQARRSELLASLPTYEDICGTIPRSDWETLAEEQEQTKTGAEWLVSRIFNQGQEGSCVGNMAVQQHEIVQALQFGLDRVTSLSPISLYQLIGRSAGSGAFLPDALRELQRTGVVPLDTPANRARFGDAVMPHTGFSTRRPPGAAEVAKQFRGIESYVIRSVEGLVSAGLRRHPIGVGRQRHAIVFLRPFFRRGSLNYLYVNSWRETWGFAAGRFRGGFGSDGLALIRQAAGWAFALRTVRTPT